MHDSYTSFEIQPFQSNGRDSRVVFVSELSCRVCEQNAGYNWRNTGQYPPNCRKANSDSSPACWNGFWTVTKAV